MQREAENADSVGSLEDNSRKEEIIMGETLKDLKERRSIKAYKPEQIKEEELQKILEAGTYAPNGMGMQSAKMIVVQDKETRDLLSKLNAANFPGGPVDIDPFYGKSDECGTRSGSWFLLDSQSQRSICVRRRKSTVEKMGR